MLVLDALTLTMAERPEWLAGWFLALVASAALCLAGMIWLLWRRRQDRATESALREELDARDRQLRDSEQVRALHEQEVEHLQTALEEQKARSGQLEQSIEHWRQQSAALENRLAALASELTAKQDRVAQLASESSQYQQRAETLSEELGQLKVELREQQVTLDKERRSASEKLELLEKNRDALKQEFENLANRIFEQKSERFSQQSKTSLDSLLNPFRDQLQDFRKRVEDVYTTETRDRQALRSEIKSLQELNRQITEEAANLTRALKGDKKIQGNWGELILERVLERSGLRKGVEYETQGSYRDEDNQLLRPDVIVHLPDQRNLVIDSKVSLVAYQQWVTADQEEERAAALKQHVEAVRNHIRALSEKDYSQLNGLHSPDFVLLFMPIEPAFVAAFQQDENLFAEAFERKIIVVTPTTLLATLRTIENIWRYERQSQNARRIADRAGAVYDKLRVFVEAMEKLGSQLHTAQGTYDNAMNTLTRGRGNLISQANRFVELGVRVKKELPKSIVDQAEVDSEDADEPGDTPAIDREPTDAGEARAEDQQE
ncbi:MULTISPECIES: DNA recombination protein RmuC [Marinobacter]|uniref:DNA recombination protein RmuC n=1 Tax=Marinobacter TaxID=2742 RepID=UPI000EDA0E4F|nr:DNA recombination protein RmuC [Marinobacter sp. UBA5687]HCL39456.1 DNA recombination protein RmuC [Marinobacter nauticus]|tara:strand:- start:2837 stop:4483 length:1647 start_codon:yes stop_codon:yes gene_type:complete